MNLKWRRQTDRRNWPSPLPTLRATAANSSLTLPAVGFGDTEMPVVGWRDGVSA
jgi:hypothetical protein